ncbi:MAG: hypothetical protein WAV28_02750 [Sedimentisphaerales bacterium]
MRDTLRETCFELAVALSEAEGYEFCDTRYVIFRAVLASKR